MLEILFQNSFITIHTINVLLVLGFLFTGTFVIRYVNKHKLNLAFLTEYFIHILLATLLMGRLAYVLVNFSDFQDNWLSVLYVWDMNFSFFGMILGFVTILFFAARRNKEDFWAWFDTFFLASLAMFFFVHVGFFFSGKDYGLPTSLPWGISFDTANIPFISPIHPTQLYAALLTLLLLTYSVNKSKRIHLSGVVGSMALMIYSLGMFGIDFLHGDPSMYVKISYGILAALGFVGYIHCTHKTHITS